jgi:integrase
MRLSAAFYEEQERVRRQTTVLRKTPPTQVTVNLWLSAYRGLFPDERSDVTKREQAYMVRPFRDAHAKLLMSEVTPIQAQAWALDHPSHVRLLYRAWEYAVQMRVAPINVWKLVTMPKRTKPRRRPPTPQELEEIVGRISEPWFRRMVILAAYTGARQGGLRVLRRVDVLGPDRLSVFEKGKKRREIIVPAIAQEALAEQMAERSEHAWQGPLLRVDSGPSPLLFVTVGRSAPKDGGSRWVAVGKDTVRDRFRNARGDFPDSFHSLRHFAGTWMRDQGVAEADIAVQLGHVDREGRPYERLVRTVYTHPSPEAHSEALARIEAVLG